MAFTSIGCVTAAPVFATQSWPAGSKTLGPVVLPDKYRYGLILLDLTQLTDLLASINVTIQVSLDGVSFQDVGGFGLDLPNSGYSINGGVLVDGAGNPVRIAGFPVKFPQSVLTTRQIQGIASLSAPATVGMTLVIY